MVPAKILLCLAALALVHCKRIAFNETNPKSSLASAETPQPPDDDVDDRDDGVAMDPTPIAGSYLACFIDPQLAPGDGIPVGCQTFEDGDWNRVKADPAFTIIKAEIRTNPAKVLNLTAMDKHPRWRWTTRIPGDASRANLVFDIRDANNKFYKMRVDLLDILPPGLATVPSLLGGRFLLRLKGSTTCLSGNPVWTWDSTNTTPITEAMVGADCSQALRFTLETFETGLRMHAANPSPNLATCETVNFIVNLCQESCVDLDDYGRGNRYSLFACTTSVEAQRQNLVPSTKGAVRVRTNGRFMILNTNKLVPTVDAGAEFEIVPTPAN